MAIKILQLKAHKRIVLKAIRKYGTGPEHNYQHYLYMGEKGCRPVFVHFGKHMGVLALRGRKGTWHTFDEVIAPAKIRQKIFIDFVNFAIGHDKAKKVVVETRENLRKSVMKKAKNEFHFPRINYSLHWPLFKIKGFDENIPGKNWKKIRNLRNRLYRFHKVRIVSSRSLKKSQLKELVKRWVRKRALRDRAEIGKYIKLIDNNFKGCDYARSILVDGKPATISAGWRIPNSKKAYSAIGILDYSADGLGETAYIDELSYLKKMKFHEVNLGGSDAPMLFFKKKFRPHKTYKTVVYSIMPPKKKKPAKK